MCELWLEWILRTGWHFAISFGCKSIHRKTFCEVGVLRAYGAVVKTVVGGFWNA